MAVLIIENWSSYCSRCGKKTTWEQSGHIFVPDDKGFVTRGCNAPWDEVSMPYALNTERFDNMEYKHFPSWIYSLPLREHA